MNYKALALGGVVGFLFALSPACGGGDDCGPANCNNGCCSSDGQCITATTPAQCGAVGNACVACPSGQSCVSGQCTGGNTGTDGGTTNKTLAQCQAERPTHPGCFVLGATCTPSAGTSRATCGTAGAECQACTGTQVCQPTGTGGGTCVTPDASSVSDGTVGSACATPTDCANVTGSFPICKTASSLGNLTYQDGYCTRRCLFDGANSPSACPSGSACIYWLGSVGEKDAVCLETCTANTDCRTGYVCLDADGSGTNVCFPAPANGQQYTNIDGGPPAGTDVMGGACTANGDCQPPNNGECTPETFADGGVSGFPGGFCTADCAYAPEICGQGGICLPFDLELDPNAPGADKYEYYSWKWLCRQECGFDGGVNPAECRNGYACSEWNAPLGICEPRCDAPGNSCRQGETCNATSGLCE